MNIETKIEIQWVRPLDLHVDQACQRKLDWKQARKIAREWDQQKFEASLPLNGSTGSDGVTVYITDGQHRLAALILRDDNDPVPVAVVHHTSQRQQAEQFLSLNGGRAPSKAEQHRIAMLAGHEDALVVGAVLEGLGLDKTVEAIDACYRVSKQYGPEVLETALLVLTEAFGRSRQSYNSNLVRGVAFILSSGGNRDRLVRTLQTLPVLRWRQEAIAKGGWHNALRDRYNRNLTKGRIQ